MASGCSIQSGSATFASGDTTKNITVSSVTVAKSFVVFSVRQADSNTSTNEQGNCNISGYLSSSTQLNLARYDSGLSVIVEWYIISFSSGMTVQRGTIANVDNSDNDISISSIDTGKTFAILSSRGRYNHGFNRTNDITADITSVTNLRLRSEQSGTWNNTTEWQVIEYDSCSVEKVSKSADGTSDSATLASSVTLDKTFIAHTSRFDEDNYPGQTHFLLWLSAVDTISFERTLDDNAVSCVIYVVKFSDDTHVERGNTSFGSGDTSINSTLTLSDYAKSFPFGGSLWFKSMGKTADYGEPYSRMVSQKINSNTVINLARYSTESDAISMRWETIQFNHTGGKIPLFDHHYRQQRG